ncbi:hypothetical protein SBI_01845 [Streptomyces bingchenggensis BCW-1]|uniref:Uncharacterized protein n=1 Tax=Streptomyces bingchenggensis (strain BCW-1) TaxID=749414 RepID=D7BPV9_STRBB|nr:MULTISPECIES: hypothetical protein [Streptomyces]ADI04966.1 hypothetical protein SBI_01845 [Streptomyces bingchenggensis BCW-1]
MPGIDECLLEAMTVNGARGAAVIEWTSGLALGMVGETRDDDPETTAAETAELARLAAEQTAFAAFVEKQDKNTATNTATDPDTAEVAEADTGAGAAGDSPVEDVIVTTRTCYHLLRFVDTAFDSGVFLYLWLDRREGNLALARIRLRDLARRLALV